MKQQKDTAEPRITHQSHKVLNVFFDDIYAEKAGSELLQVTGLASGTLYPILLRLEDAGWLKSRWEKIDPSKEGRPRRRLYLLTARGLSRYSELRDEAFGGVRT